MSVDAASGDGSERWQHFHAALRSTIRHAAHKWTWDNFTECFLEFCEIDGDGARRVFDTVSRHLESSLVEQTDRFFDGIKLKECIDNLDAAIADAKLSKEGGEVRPDIWREDLQPRAATQARAIPSLEKKRDRMLAVLQELEEENLKMRNKIDSNIQQLEEKEKEKGSLLDMMHEIVQQWEHLEHQQTAETPTNFVMGGNWDPQGPAAC